MTVDTLENQDTNTHPVHRRLVCYLSGFDPQGAPFYHRLYKEEAQKQAQVSGYTLDVGPRRNAGNYVAWWDVKYNKPNTENNQNETVETRYEFLRWDDIVRNNWPRTVIGLLWRILWASAHLWFNGLMWKVLKASWPRFLVIAMPGLLVVLFGLLWLIFGAVGLHWAWHGQSAGLLLPALGWPSLFYLAKHADRYSYASWLMRSTATMVDQAHGNFPELDERLNVFAQHIAQQYLNQAVDELLIVGHSSGAMMAAIVTARALALIEKAPPPEKPPQLSFLTVGQCAVMLSYQPAAQWFRNYLIELTRSEKLNWVDFGAPADGCCLPMSDITGPALPLNQPGRRPKLLNPKFAELFSPDAYLPVRKEKKRCHFQYLMAGQYAGDYDYFAITAGNKTLTARYTDRQSNTNFRKFQLFGGPDWC